jgi:hypothetical protein
MKLLEIRMNDEPVIQEFYEESLINETNLVSFVKNKLISFYMKDEVSLEDLIEGSKIEIRGIPLYLSIAVYCQLKEEIDEDIITISNPNGDIDEMSLSDYLIYGICQEEE